MFDSGAQLRDNGFMNITLAKDVEEFLNEQVRSGACADPDELVNDLVRHVREQQRVPFEVTPQLETWLLEAADACSTPLREADFEAVRQRVQDRVPRDPA
jgi:Arc/MetJ-type ribon-helix-helix transcriptional regulator